MEGAVLLPHRIKLPIQKFCLERWSWRSAWRWCWWRAWAAWSTRTTWRARFASVELFAGDLAVAVLVEALDALPTFAALFFGEVAVAVLVELLQEIIESPRASAAATAAAAARTLWCWWSAWRWCGWRCESASACRERNCCGKRHCDERELET
jgi:hypothetical protein